jgi:hypothetical protein
MRGYNQFFGVSFLKLTDSKGNWIESLRKESITEGWLIYSLIYICIYLVNLAKLKIYLWKGDNDISTLMNNLENVVLVDDTSHFLNEFKMLNIYLFIFFFFL